MRFQNIVVSIAYKRDSETAKELHKKISIFNIILKIFRTNDCLAQSFSRKNSD